MAKRPVLDPRFAEKSTVIFLDLLGFATLLGQRTDYYNRPDVIRQVYTSPSRHPMTLAAADVRRTYNAFQAETGKLVRYAQRARASQRPTSSILFSDSVYLFFQSTREAVVFSRVAMQSMIRSRLPVRIGIGWGTADRLSFRSETSPRGDVLLSAPFLGTGVVNAYKAESCGVRGMRILVHDSVAYLLEKELPEWLLRLPRSEATEHVEYEINYLNSTGTDTSTAFCLSRVRQMQERVPDDKKAIYDTTLKALARMAKANSPSGRRQREARKAKEARKKSQMWNVTIERLNRQLSSSRRREARTTTR